MQAESTEGAVPGTVPTTRYRVTRRPALGGRWHAAGQAAGLDIERRANHRAIPRLADTKVLRGLGVTGLALSGWCPVGAGLVARSWAVCYVCVRLWTMCGLQGSKG